MPECQVRAASRFAFPRGPTAVEDRRMSLEMLCREDATESCGLLSAASGRQRNNGTVQQFNLCQNHAQLMTQVDGELVNEESWATAFAQRPTSIY